MNLSNYHTHSTFCDGADAPEEIVREAIRRGCPELGFSGHSHIPFDDCCMSVEGTEEYKAEIRRLREKYADRIRIWLGVEQDIFGDLPTDDYDYVIGSVHFVFRDGRYLSVDESRESFLDHVAHFYGGDILAFVSSVERDGKIVQVKEIAVGEENMLSLAVCFPGGRHDVQRDVLRVDDLFDVGRKALLFFSHIKLFLCF